MSYSDKSDAAQQTPAIRRDEQSIAGQPDAFSAEERELLNELLRALRSMRYGSVVLTVHDGRLVEIQKTERIRRGAPNRKV